MTAEQLRNRVEEGGCANPYCDGKGWIKCEKEGRVYMLPACKVGPHPTPTDGRRTDG